MRKTTHARRSGCGYDFVLWGYETKIVGNEIYHMGRRVESTPNDITLLFQPEHRTGGLLHVILLSIELKEKGVTQEFIEKERTLGYEGKGSYHRLAETVTEIWAKNQNKSKFQTYLQEYIELAEKSPQKITKEQLINLGTFLRRVGDRIKEEDKNYTQLSCC